MFAFSQTVFASDPAQFAALKKCQRSGSYGAQTLTGDCAAYSSPDAALPSLYDGTLGTAYSDPVFGTKIKRITTQSGMPVGSYFPKYASSQAWSKDGSYLILGGPSGYLYLFEGNEPYSYIRQINVANDGADELWYAWSNTDNCIFYNTHYQYIRKVDVCNNDQITNIGVFDTLADSNGNVLDLTGGNLSIKPYMYANITDDDHYLAAKVINKSAGAVYGFGVFDLLNGTNVWFHKINAPGDLIQNGAPANTIPKSAQISGDGSRVVVQWNSDGYKRTISLLSRSGNIVTLKTSSALSAGYVSGSSISIFGSSDNSFNGVFDNITVVDSTTITFNQNGPDATVSSSRGYLYYKHFGKELYDGVTGDFIKIFSEKGDDHSDMARLSNNGYSFISGGSITGLFSSYPSMIYRQRGIYDFNTDLTSACTEPDESYSSNRQWHISGRGTNSTNGLKGWGLVSTYYEGDYVDNNPAQTPLFGEIYACALDGSNTIYRIAHAQSRKNGNYYAEPHATPNRDFTKILFGSTWRISGNISGSVQAYVIELSNPIDFNAPSVPMGLSVQ